MTNNEIIRKWKENEKAFGLVDLDMKNWAENTGARRFECYNADRVWSLGGDGSFWPQTTYKLPADYTEEPEVKLRQGEIYLLKKKDWSKWSLGMNVEAVEAGCFSFTRTDGSLFNVNPDKWDFYEIGRKVEP